VKKDDRKAANAIAIEGFFLITAKSWGSL